MAFRFVVIPVQAPDAAEAELNLFLANHPVLSVDRRWVDQGQNSFWALCIDYLTARPGGDPPRADPRVRNRVDYKERLSPVEFAAFSRLRELRKQIAQAEAVPVYTVFTNDQLAQIVQTRAQSKADLGKIEGIGDARIEKYAERILPLVASLPIAAPFGDGRRDPA